MRSAMEAIANAAMNGLRGDALRDAVRRVVRAPHLYGDDPIFGSFAKRMVGDDRPRTDSAPWRQWGSDLDPSSVAQIEAACRLPVAVAGALMPDAHVGYGLPIGGVLATDNAVIPYAVGVDIACRMKLTVFDIPVEAIQNRRDHLVEAIEAHTRFGVGGSFRKRHEHEVMDADWSTSPVTNRLKDKAWSQLGTSGSGNHFVEFGVLTLDQPDLELEVGEYLALLSHSGSRGSGAAVADHYSKLAMAEHPDLPPDMRRLAWLNLDSEVGQEYWLAMELMGRYAAANHAIIHSSIAAHLGAAVIAGVENHHNFAWREDHAGINGGKPVVVHRKGATPAGAGVLGVIPGSMASPGFVVRGRGEPASLASASHGAGRAMSRTQARNSFRWHMVVDRLQRAGVHLISAGLDEIPMVYKDIHEVMAAQHDLVDVIARFDPKIVKMAPEGEQPED